LIFQADETKIGVLANEMDRLLKKFLAKFVQLRHIKGQADLKQIKYETLDLQHDDDTLAVGMPARSYLSELEDEDQSIKHKFIRWESHLF